MVIKLKFWKFVHVFLWLLWAVATVGFYSKNAEESFNLLFGKYFSYDFFYWLELIFMFGGGLLLLALLIKLLPDKLSYLSYIVFEIIFISIIVTKFIIVFY